MRPAPALAFLALAGFAPLALAQAPDDRATPVEGLTVTATRIPQPGFDVPAAIDVVDARAISEGKLQVNLSESLGRVPGIVVRNRQNYAQDLQVSSRGFGARSTFGVRGVRLIADGSPATMPDGQGQAATFAPAACIVGDHALFRGAALVDPESNLVARLVVDPSDGPALRVYDADEPFDRSVLFFRDECMVFTMELEETGTMVNNIVERRLELEVECENEDGATIRGSASVARCD